MQKKQQTQQTQETNETSQVSGTGRPGASQMPKGWETAAALDHVIASVHQLWGFYNQELYQSDGAGSQPFLRDAPAERTRCFLDVFDDLSNAEAAFMALVMTIVVATDD